ncbi:MAG: ATP synthase F1 subunit gamma [Gemmatimonadetes bacterium]|nr:ATP synthase F1 subunit gamma [Gemmatimonadota bacterium]
MAKAREIKRRIRSVDNTRKITRTMEMVATSKLKRATDRVQAARPYAEAIGDVVRSLYSPALGREYPLLRQPEAVRKVAVLLLTANRGFAGAFNANLIREGARLLAELRAQGLEVQLHIVGKKGASYFRFRGESIASTDLSVTDRPSPEDAERLIAPLRDRFAAGELDAVYVIASEFRSAMSAPPASRLLLPVQAGEGSSTSADSFILSPSAGAILEGLLPAYVRNTVYRALVENAAAEQGARRTAMKNATDNAGDMLESLTRTYNRARQAQITQEIAEIVGGAAALE